MPKYKVNGCYSYSSTTYENFVWEVEAETKEAALEKIEENVDELFDQHQDDDLIEDGATGIENIRQIEHWDDSNSNDCGWDFEIAEDKEKETT